MVPLMHLSLRHNCDYWFGIVFWIVAMDLIYFYLMLVFVSSGTIAAILLLSLAELLAPWARKTFLP